MPVSWLNGVAQSLFATLFPADCRFCANPLTNISRLPIYMECLSAMRPIAGGLCSVCGERVLFEPRRETVSQIGLTRHQRRANIRGAFVVSDSAKVSGRECLLVDDALTTGTTAWDCARVLRRAGASKVWIATVAGTLKSEVAFSRPTPKEDAGLTMAAAS